MKLVASLLTRNELGRLLEQCVGSLLEFCDEIRAVDDASTDGTFEFLADIGDRVQVVQLPATRFFGHEGQTRQSLLDWTLRGDPDYVVAIDADEFVTDGAALREACEQGVTSLTVEMVEVWEATRQHLCVRVDGGWRPHPTQPVWKVPSRMDGRWRIADRQLACGRVPVAVDRMRGAYVGAELLHFGWTSETARAARHERYAVADGGRFHRSQHLDSILYDCDRVELQQMAWPDGLASRRDAILAQVTSPTSPTVTA